MLFAPALLSLVLISAIISGAISSRLWGHPRAALWVSACSAATTLGVITAHVVVPIVHQSPDASYSWPTIAVDYFMAMGHRLYGGAYAFTWTPRWIYEMSAFTPLVAPGAAVTVAAAFTARRESRVAASLLMAVGALTFAAFMSFACYVALATLKGIPV